jgi:glutamate-1-semialdehyde aminotransferase
LRNMADIVNNTHHEWRKELAARLRNHGVFIFHGGALSTEHTEGDIQSMLTAYGRCAEEMAAAHKVS